MPATAGSARARAAAVDARPGSASTACGPLRVQDLGDPAIDDALAVGARVVRIDGKERCGDMPGAQVGLA